VKGSKMDKDYEAMARELGRLWGTAKNDGCSEPDCHIHTRVPDYANSVDALLRDMPESWSWEIWTAGKDRRARVHNGTRWDFSSSDTPAHALLSACHAAREAKK